MSALLRVSTCRGDDDINLIPPLERFTDNWEVFDFVHAIRRNDGDTVESDTLDLGSDRTIKKAAKERVWVCFWFGDLKPGNKCMKDKFLWEIATRVLE